MNASIRENAIHLVKPNDNESTGDNSQKESLRTLNSEQKELTYDYEYFQREVQ